MVNERHFMDNVPMPMRFTDAAKRSGWSGWEVNIMSQKLMINTITAQLIWLERSGFFRR